MVHCDMFHIVQYCRELAPYYIIDERTQESIFTDLDTVVSERRSERYLRARQEASSLDRDWESFPLHSIVANLELTRKGPADRVAAIWLGLGLNFYGDRVARYRMGERTTSIHLTEGCIQCGQLEGGNHILLHCTHCDAIELRGAAMSEIQKTITKYRENGPIAHALDAMVEVAMREDPNLLLWQGVWDNRSIELIEGALGEELIRQMDARDLIRAIRSLKKTLVKHARLANALRHRWHAGLQRTANQARKHPATVPEEPTGPQGGNVLTGTRATTSSAPPTSRSATASGHRNRTKSPEGKILSTSRASEAGIGSGAERQEDDLGHLDEKGDGNHLTRVDGTCKGNGPILHDNGDSCHTPLDDEICQPRGYPVMKKAGRRRGEKTRPQPQWEPISSDVKRTTLPERYSVRTAEPERLGLFRYFERRGRGEEGGEKYWERDKDDIV